MKVSRETFPLYALKGLQILMWGISGIAFLSAFMLIITPCILPFLSFGACIMQGRQEYLEYALTSFQMAIFPALVASFTALCGYGLRQFAQRLQLEAQRAALEQLDHERMRALARQNSRRLSV